MPLSTMEASKMNSAPHGGRSHSNCVVDVAAFAQASLDGANTTTAASAVAVTCDGETSSFQRLLTTTEESSSKPSVSTELSAAAAKGQTQTRLPSEVAHAIPYWMECGLPRGRVPCAAEGDSTSSQGVSPSTAVLTPQVSHGISVTACTSPVGDAALPTQGCDGAALLESFRGYSILPEPDLEGVLRQSRTDESRSGGDVEEHLRIVPAVPSTSFISEPFPSSRSLRSAPSLSLSSSSPVRPYSEGLAAEAYPQQSPKRSPRESGPPRPPSPPPLPTFEAPPASNAAAAEWEEGLFASLKSGAPHMVESTGPASGLFLHQPPASSHGAAASTTSTAGGARPPFPAASSSVAVQRASLSAIQPYPYVSVGVLQRQRGPLPSPPRPSPQQQQPYSSAACESVLGHSMTGSMVASTSLHPSTTALYHGASAAPPPPPCFASSLHTTNSAMYSTAAVAAAAASPTGGMMTPHGSQTSFFVLLPTSEVAPSTMDYVTHAPLLQPSSRGVYSATSAFPALHPSPSQSMSGTANVSFFTAACASGGGGLPSLTMPPSLPPSQPPVLNAPFPYNNGSGATTTVFVTAARPTAFMGSSQGADVVTSIGVGGGVDVSGPVPTVSLPSASFLHVSPSSGMDNNARGEAAGAYGTVPPPRPPPAYSPRCSTIPLGGTQAAAGGSKDVAGAARSHPGATTGMQRGEMLFGASTSSTTAGATGEPLAACVGNSDVGKAPPNYPGSCLMGTTTADIGLGAASDTSHKQVNVHGAMLYTLPYFPYVEGAPPAPIISITSNAVPSLSGPLNQSMTGSVRSMPSTASNAGASLGGGQQALTTARLQETFLAPSFRRGCDETSLANAPVLPIFIQMFPCELTDRAGVLNRVIEATCGPHAGVVKGVETRSETSFIAYVQTQHLWELIYQLRCRVLMDRFGFWYAANLEQYARMKEYCEWVRRLPQQTRHIQTDGLPCMPLVVELSRSADRCLVPENNAPCCFDKVLPITAVERHRSRLPSTQAHGDPTATNSMDMRLSATGPVTVFSQGAEGTALYASFSDAPPSMTSSGAVCGPSSGVGGGSGDGGYGATSNDGLPVVFLVEPYYLPQMYTP